jgi:cysteinyl-tRNA synthetase
MTTATATQPKTDTVTNTNTLRIYNTLSRQKEPFEPVTPGKVGIYLCGPTVYKEAHIGHMVGPVIFDTIKRYLVHSGYEVDLVVNITDVDDKLIAQSQNRGIPMSQVATEMTCDYCANLLSLGVNQITHMPRATDNMDEIIALIGELVDKGFAYQVGGDVFFEVSKDKEYGKLTNRSPEDQQGEGGGAAAKKRAAGDFALWKSAKPGEPSWASPWGDGRPGWHIECSAMSKAIFGETFDIHGGGLDLTFPHHENEIAQSECCHGKPMAQYWMHNGLMRASAGAGKLGGRNDRDDASPTEEATIDTKISRSKGAGGLRDLIARQGGERLRYFLIKTHYRSTIDFSEAGIEEAGTNLEKFYTLFERYERITGRSFYIDNTNNDEDRELIRTRAAGEFDPGDSQLLSDVKKLRDGFLTKMDDDFNTGGAVSDLFGLLSALNKFADAKKLEDAKARQDQDVADFMRAVETLRELSAILGIFLKPPATITGSGEEDALLDDVMKLLIDLRAQARQNKNFEMADAIRDRLTALGVTLEDRAGETGWKRE